MAVCFGRQTSSSLEMEDFYSNESTLFDSNKQANSSESSSENSLALKRLKDLEIENQKLKIQNMKLNSIILRPSDGQTTPPRTTGLRQLGARNGFINSVQYSSYGSPYSKGGRQQSFNKYQDIFFNDRGSNFSVGNFMYQSFENPSSDCIEKFLDDMPSTNFNIRENTSNFESPIKSEFDKQHLAHFVSPQDSPNYRIKCESFKNTTFSRKFTTENSVRPMPSLSLDSGYGGFSSAFASTTESKVSIKIPHYSPQKKDHFPAYQQLFLPTNTTEAKISQPNVITGIDIPKYHEYLKQIDSSLKTFVPFAHSSFSNAVAKTFNRVSINTENLDRLGMKQRDTATIPAISDANTYAMDNRNCQTMKNSSYSTKVFLGGIPWDMNNEEMLEVFQAFEPTSIQRPGTEVRLSRSSQVKEKAGYAYIILSNQSAVLRLIQACKMEITPKGCKYFFTVTSKRTHKEKRVEIIPWNTADTLFEFVPQWNSDHSRTVFLGALHGVMSAKTIGEALCKVFGQVDYVCIDTDKYQYPMGSGRAIFSNVEDFQKAVSAAYIQIKSDRFEKTIQIDEYLDDVICSICKNIKGPILCKTCDSKYMCTQCYVKVHEGIVEKHSAISKSRNETTVRS